MNSRCAIGLDVGGTKVAGGIVAEDGAIAFQQTIPTLPKRGGDAVARDVYHLAERLIDQGADSGLIPRAIGISICELVNKDGEIASDETIQWRDLSIQQRFTRLAPTTVEADCRAAARCEARCGAGSRFSTFLYITIGTGISCSLVIDGAPYVGARGFTGTMATGPLTTICSSCGGTSVSVIEQIASGPAIASRYSESVKNPASGSEVVLEAAHNGDAVAREIIVTATESLGSLIGLLVNVLDPHAVVVGGGLGSAAGLYWETVQSATRRHIWSDEHRQLPIVQGKYGGVAGLVGAAISALEANV